MTASATLPVLIIGAGPVGLCLARYLEQQGVRSCVIERFNDKEFSEQEARAGSIHPATLEMLDTLGLYQGMERRGLISPTVQYWDRVTDEMFAELDHAVLKNDTRFPYVLQCERTKIIDEAMQMMRDSPLCKIRMSTEFKSFTQDGDGVDAVVTNAAGEDEHIRAQFIVSAEGGRSIVRKTLDIEFEGYTYPERTLTVAVCHDFDKIRGYSYRNYLSDPDQWSNLFKWVQPERWRVHFPTDINDAPEKVLSDEHIQTQLQKFLPSDKPYEVVHRTLYTVHQRVAATFRAGRAILAGDSAHINSPIGAMGMNSGIHDAMNLGEKLTGILRGEYGHEVLDRYTRQRKYVAVNHTQLQTERNKKLLSEKDPAIRQKNHDNLKRTANDPKLAREFMMRSSLFNSLREAAEIA
jgi:3-(3-hydroxy-phenyl)propionate hydroxylase